MGAASGMRGEVEAAVRRRLEQALSGMDLVSRDEFDAVREMAAKARTEQETLNKRVAELEAAIERMQG
jgi:BMFP domain-containing protein YqiC